MEIAGLPLHPLVVHAAVVFLPLAVLSAWAAVALPRWRWLTRWTTLALTLAGAGAGFVARASGQALLKDRPFLLEGDTPVAQQIQTHQERANLLAVAIVVFVVAVVAAFLVQPATTGLASGRLEHRGRGSARWGTAISVLLVVSGLAVLVLTALTGEPARGRGQPASRLLSRRR